MAYVRTLLVGLLLLYGGPRVGYAGCLLKAPDSGFRFSDAAREVRDAFFASLCDKSFSELLIYPDPRLKERFSPPSRERRSANEISFPGRAARLGFEGSPVVAYVVETNGSVEHVLTIQSSGHQLLDEAAFAFFKELRFDIPGKVDGIPVRVMYTHQINFKIDEAAGRFSTAFTDKAIIDLGNRLVDLCNRGDVDCIYDSLDETAKHKLSRADIKQQLRLYNGLYGAIAGARFEGLLRADIQKGVYELAYALDLDRPGAENVVMDVVVGDRVDPPRIFSYWIDRKIVIYRGH